MLRRRRHVVVSRRSIHVHLSLAHLALGECAESQRSLVRRVSATPWVFCPDRQSVSPRRWTLCTLVHRGVSDASTSRRIGGAPIPHDASAQLPLSRPVA